MGNIRGARDCWNGAVRPGRDFRGHRLVGHRRRYSRIAAPGHTPGHAMLCGRAAGEAVLFSGDVLHHPLQLLDPKLDSARALETRLSLIDRCVDAPVWLMTGHCIAPSGGRIVRQGEHLQFRFLDQ